MPVFYKPQLTEDRAKLIVRCLTHCLECSDIFLSAEETRSVLHFCNAVNERDFVTTALARIERIKGINPPEPNQP